MEAAIQGRRTAGTHLTISARGSLRPDCRPRSSLQTPRRACGWRRSSRLPGTGRPSTTGARSRRSQRVAAFTTTIDGLDIHFIHVKSRHENALPVIITHGWPGSVVEMLDVIGPLTDPTAYGGTAADAFDVVIPSLPDTGSRASQLSWAGAATGSRGPGTY